MSEPLEQMTDDELIEYALEHCGEGKEMEERRRAALMLHDERTRHSPTAIVVPPGASEAEHRSALRAKIGSVG